MGEYASDFWKAIGYSPNTSGRPPRVVRFKKFFLTTKVGPNSAFTKANALWSAVSDLLILPDSLVESIRVVGGEDLWTRMQTLKKYATLLPFPRNGSRFRKISAIESDEGKTREVAILDY